MKLGFKIVVGFHIERTTLDSYLDKVDTGSWAEYFSEWDLLDPLFLEPLLLMVIPGAWEPVLLTTLTLRLT